MVTLVDIVFLTLFACFVTYIALGLYHNTKTHKERSEIYNFIRSMRRGYIQDELLFSYYKTSYDDHHNARMMFKDWRKLYHKDIIEGISK